MTTKIIKSVLLLCLTSMSHIPLTTFASDTGPENISIKGIRLGQTAKEIQTKLEELGFTTKAEKVKKTYKIQGVHVETEEFIAQLSANHLKGYTKEHFKIWFTPNEGGNVSHLINYTNNVSQNPYVASELREKMFKKFGGAVKRSKGTGKFKELYKYYYTDGNRILCELKNCPNPATRVRSHDRGPGKGSHNPFNTRLPELLATGKTAAIHAQFDMSVRQKGETLYTKNFTIQLSGEAVRKEAGEKEKEIIEAEADKKAKAIQPSAAPDL